MAEIASKAQEDQEDRGLVINDSGLGFKRYAKQATFSTAKKSKRTLLAVLSSPKVHGNPDSCFIEVCIVDVCLSMFFVVCYSMILVFQSPRRYW